MQRPPNKGGKEKGIWEPGTHLLKSLPTFSEWQLTVWKVKDMPMHMMAPAKKLANTTFSCHWISAEGRVRKYSAIPVKARHPRGGRVENSVGRRPPF